MHRCSNDNNPNCDHCGLTEDTLFVLTPIYKMFKNTENMGTLSNHTYKTDRKNLYPTTIRSKYSITTHINKQNKGTSTNHCTNTLQKNKLQSILDQFREQFCINEVVANIENNSLRILLTQITNYRQVDRQPGVQPC